MTNSWDDIYTDGRRLEKIIKFCETMIFKKDTDEQLKLSYIDRMIKATHQKVEIVKIDHGLQHYVTEGRRLYGIPKPPSMLREEKKAKNSLDN